MSIIVPAGNKNVKWSPEDETLTKTAATAAAPVDALYDAAKKVVTAQFEEEKKEEKKEEDPVVEVKDVASGESAEKEAIKNIEQKVEEVQTAVQEAKEVLEVEVEVEEEKQGDDVKEVSIEVEPMKDDGLVVESKPDACSCGTMAKTEEKIVEAKKEEKKEEKKDEKKEEKKDDKKEVEAAVAEQFYRFGKISGETRKKIIDFWKNDLGYPADYVALMAKDYEK